MSYEQQLAEAEYYRSIGIDLPAGWIPFRWDCGRDTAPEGFTKVEGAVVPLKMSGKNKGKQHYDKRDKSTEKAFFVTNDQLKKAWGKA